MLPTLKDKFLIIFITIIAIILVKIRGLIFNKISILKLVAKTEHFDIYTLKLLHLNLEFQLLKIKFGFSIFFATLHHHNFLSTTLLNSW